MSYVDLVAKHEPLHDELRAVLDRVLAHGQFVLGPEVGELEAQLAERFAVPHVVACGSGTDALLLALHARNIGPGDEVITTAHSFVATGNAIALTGATPRFADIEDETMCIDAKSVERSISSRTKAIIVVHLNGFPCNTQPLAELAKHHSLLFVEDCAQAFGAKRAGRSVGTDGMGAFSFHPLKVLSACGDGGAISVDNEDDRIRLTRLRNHGLIDRDRTAHVGFNSRLDSLQAGFVLAKLRYVDEWIEKRRKHAAKYRDAIGDIVRLPPVHPDCEPIYSAFVIRHPRRDAILRHLQDSGVDAKVHYPLAIHEHPAFANVTDPLPVTARVISEILSLPVSAELSDADQEFVVEQVREAVAKL